MRIIITGSVAYDYIMSFPGDFSEHILPDKIDVLSVSFLVDSLRREPGGCAANIAYNLALLGECPHVMATVGADFAYDHERLEQHGVDMSLTRVLPDESTSSFFVSTDRKNRQIASFYVGAMGSATQLSFHDLDAASIELAVIAPNAPEAMVKYVQECRDLEIPYVYDPSQQIVRLSGEALVAGIEGCTCFVANEYEFELVHEKTGLTEDAIVGMTDVVVITHGEKGSVIRAGGETHVIPAVPATRQVDPTGIGDAYRSGIMFGLLHGLPWPVAGRAGALAATYALESLGTQAHRYTIPSFTKRYAEHFGDIPDALVDALNRAHQHGRHAGRHQGA
ncbi:MAG: carbohydrate kinase family protein [Caldilineae bacterium]|nr:carbohydrate kinase family protein [Chloroflexota bacterium]MCB9175911.1 carbohydrate kinase family protein [Caldilineae bacterium]